MPVPDAPMPETMLQVSPSAGLSEVATPDAFGASVGQSVGTLGEVQTRLFHDANASAVMAAHNAVDAAANDQLYNRKTGLLFQNLGEQAPSAVDKTDFDYKAKVSEVRGGLTNDAQRAMFDKSMGEHGIQFQRTLAEYEHRQVTAGQNANTAAYLDNRKTDIAQNFDKPDLVNAAIQQSRNAVVQAYARNNSRDPVALQASVDNGTAPEGLKDALAKTTSDNHMVAINTMLSNELNPAAKAYFDAHKEELTAADLDKATRMVRVGTQADEARGIANDIIAKQHVDSVGETGPEDKSKISLEDALNRLEARGVQDTAIHDAAEARIVHHFHLMGEAHKELQGQLVDQATQAIEDPDNVNRTVPANVLGQMDLREKKAVLSYASQLLKEGRVTTDEGTRLRLRTMAADPDQWDAFVAENPKVYKGALNNVDYRAYENAWADVKGKVQKRDDKLSQGQIAVKAASDLMKENGLEIPANARPGTPAYEAAAKRQNDFMDQLHRAVGAEALAKKRDLSDPEIRDQARQLFTQQTWQKPLKFYDYIGRGSGTSLFGTDKESGPAYTAPFAKDIVYDESQIPAETLRQMIQSEQKAGHTNLGKERVRQYNDMVRARYDASLTTP